MNVHTVQHTATASVVPPAFEHGDWVNDGEWTAMVLAAPCGRGIVPIMRIYDDEGRLHLVHGSKLRPGALPEDGEMVDYLDD
jgi:hypothetical protein